MCMCVCARTIDVIGSVHRDEVGLVGLQLRPPTALINSPYEGQMRNEIVEVVSQDERHATETRKFAHYSGGLATKYLKKKTHKTGSRYHKNE